LLEAGYGSNFGERVRASYIYLTATLCVMDSSAITAAFGLEPSPWDDICRRTAK